LRWVGLVGGEKRSVQTFYTFGFYGARCRGTGSRFKTLRQLPIARRSGPHFNVTAVSRRRRTGMREELWGAPLALVISMGRKHGAGAPCWYDADLWPVITSARHPQVRLGVWAGVLAGRLRR
jgi:hypothetical protein